MRKALILASLALRVVGLLWPWPGRLPLGRLPLGRLPGDLVVEQEHFCIYWPLTTCALLSLVASLLFWLFRQ